MAMPGRHERPPAAGGDRGVLPGVEVEPGVAGMGVGAAAGARGRAGRRPARRSGIGAGCVRTDPSRIRIRQIGHRRSLRPMERPPSVDALARSLAGRAAAPAARRRRPPGDRRRCRRRGAGTGRGAAPHAADAGRQRHRRAAAHQPRPGAAGPPPGGPGRSRSSSTWRPASAARASAASARCSPGCAAPRRRWSSTTTPPPCCWCWLPSPPAATCRVSRGESVEIGGGFRVPEVMEQSGARLRRRRHHQPHPPRRLPAGDRPPAPTSRWCSRCTRATTASTGSSRTRRSPSWRRSACRSSPTSAAAWSTPTCPWWPGRTRRRGWRASRRRARRSPPVPRSSRSAATSCSAARRPGSSPAARDLVERCAAPPAGPRRCARAGSCSPRCRTSPSPTCGATSWHGPVLADGGHARRRARAGGPSAIAAPTGADAVATDAVPGAGSAPGATIPSFGVRVAGDRLAALARPRPPVIARARDGATVLDLRAVEPADDAVIVDALARLG